VKFFKIDLFFLQLIMGFLIGNYFVSSIHAKSNSEPKITVQASGISRTFSRSSLLSRSDLVTIELESDPAYPGKKIKYQAIPMRELFREISIPKDGVLLFKCLDGFSATLSKDRILNNNQNGSIAYLAIEPDSPKWPPLKPSESSLSAGPFYVIWKNPKASNISVEEWPYQVIGFEVKNSLQFAYPALFPGKSFGAENPVSRGVKVFAKNCLACHTLNLQGGSNTGPDLNIPMNPIEYFKEPVLKKFIRDPGSVRNWPSRRMPGLAQESLSDSELEDLISYLKYMSKHKVKSK
jgi:cytochrome c2